MIFSWYFAGSKVDEMGVTKVLSNQCTGFCLERLRKFWKLQKTKITWHYRMFFEFRCSFEDPSRYQNTLFSPILKTHASAQDEILTTDWTKLSSPSFCSLLNLQNILKKNHLLTIWLSHLSFNFCQAFWKTQLYFFFRIFDVHKHWHFKGVLEVLFVVLNGQLSSPLDRLALLGVIPWRVLIRPVFTSY
jgi:hypothetical protein